MRKILTANYTEAFKDFIRELAFISISLRKEKQQSFDGLDIEYVLWLERRNKMSWTVWGVLNFGI